MAIGKKMLTVRMSRALHEAIRVLAHEEWISMEELVREAMIDACQRNAAARKVLYPKTQENRNADFE